MKKAFYVSLIFVFILLGCSNNTESSQNDKLISFDNSLNNEMYKGFSLDNVIDSEYCSIHYNIYVPPLYNSFKQYALFITLPGYQGLYRFGVASNLKTENFAFEAQKYNKDMIIVAPQLNDWGVTSANQTIYLTNYIFTHYNIDREKVFINGYSGGGETLSLVLTYQPELYTAALHVASIWDGDLTNLVNTKTPIYFVIGENDEYYGSKRISKTYDELVNKYKELKLTDKEIESLAILDIKTASYFNISNQHGGIGKVASDKKIMGWLFNR